MFLTDWLSWMDHYPLRAAAALTAAVLFAWLYLASQRSWRKADEARAARLLESLRLYGAAEHALRILPSDDEGMQNEPLPEDERTGSLLSCLAAPYITPDLRSQIGAYLQDFDAARLALLRRTLSREASRLAAEHLKLLNACEQPGWGRTLWRQLRPALPFAFLTAGILLCAWLAQALYELPAPASAGYGWDLACTLARFVSGLFSLLMFGQALLVNRRPAPGSGLLRGLAAVIAALFLVHLAGAEAAPYTLAAQLLLFLLGFRWTDGKPRKARPFPGHYDPAGSEEAPASAEEPPPSKPTP
ncbi:hypothetical protein [Paenibacillus caui]|uniref:hypothetical protein n=1 Tax=Paenibacillus caui TaxID=2873927 RepID=UPI001CA7DF31|nr:hypothetical protein [Paenibacillus caui]